MKQTEIGLIPDDWEVKTLGCITTHVDYRGKTPKKTNIGIQLITAKNIRMGYIDYKNNQEFVSPKEYSEVMKRGLPKKGDVLITTEAPAGNVAQIDNENVALAQRVIKYRGNETLNNNYLCYYFLSDAFQNLLHSLNTGGTVQGIKGSLLHTLPVIVPPLAEQQRIAKALSDVDALISTTEKLIQKKKNIKQGAMQNLLTGKKRLPGFGPQTKSPSYKQTELGPIPEDWEVKSLGEICDLINGDRSSKYPKDEEMVSVGIPFINAGHLKDGTVDFNEMDYITRSHYESLSGAKIQKGDILFCLRGSLGKNALVDFNEGAPASSLCVIRNKKIDEKLLFQIINSELFEKQIIDANSGSSQPNLSAKDASNFLIPISQKKEEQNAIANVLSSMDKEIETLNTKLEKYRNLKTSMMQQLLTGKIRLV